MAFPVPTVFVDDEGVRFTHADGGTDEVSWADLQLAGVETNALGPFLEDVYLILEGPRYRFYIPQGARGTKELIRRLLALPGFDGEAFASAMASTDDKRFICWRRQDQPRSR